MSHSLAGVAERGASHSDHESIGFFRVAVVGLVLSQRFALPLGGSQQVPLVLPLALLWFVYGLSRGHLVVARPAARVFGASLLVIVTLTLLAILRGVTAPLFSLFFLVALYLPAVARLSSTDPSLVRQVHVFFVKTMAIISAPALILFIGQFSGIPYRDYGFESLPVGWVQQGYNTAYPLFWQSPIYRSNGLIFLEASFFSLFVAAAALMALWYGCRPSVVAILVCGAAVSASGNGIIILALGLLFQLGTSRRGLLRRYTPVAIVFLALLALTPLGRVFLSRSTEVSADESSGSLRLVQPFQEVIPAVLADPVAMLIGNGPGSVTDFYESVAMVPGSLAPVPLKLLYEYGVVGCVAFMIFLLTAFTSQLRSRPWVPGLLIAYLLVNAALLQATIAMLAILFLAIVAERHPAPVKSR